MGSVSNYSTMVQSPNTIDGNWTLWEGKVEFSPRTQLIFFPILEFRGGSMKFTPMWSMT